MSGRAQFTLGAAVLILAVAFAAVSRHEPTSRTAVPPPAKSDQTLPAEHTSQGRALDTPDTRGSSTEVSLEDLTNAREIANPDERELVIAQLLARLVEIDSQAAAQFAEHVTEAGLREVSLRVVAQRWVHIDPAATTLWAASLADPRERDQAISNVSLELAQIDPLQAVRLLERQFTSDIPAGVLEGVVQQWAEKSYEDALAWSDTLPQGPRRELVLQRLVFVRANQNPIDAARLAEQAFADSDKRTDALASVAASWGSRDPMSAREWARTLAGHTRERVDAELALLGTP